MIRGLGRGVSGGLLLAAIGAAVAVLGFTMASVLLIVVGGVCLFLGVNVAARALEGGG